MRRGLGFNVHLSYISDAYWQTLLTRFERTKPGALLLLDSFASGKELGRVLEAERRLPDTVIVYRKFLGGDNQQQRMTPGQVPAEYASIAGTRIYGAVNNEPGFAPSLAWHLDVMKTMRAAGIRASIGGYSVGVPEPDQIPQADALLRYMAANPGWFLLDLHEYAKALWTFDFAPDARNPQQWPARVPQSTTLWLMGRFRFWLDYCDRAGIKRPRIVIGEWGFDGTSALGDSRGMHRAAGVWQAWGVGDWQQYAALQLKAAWRAIYADVPEIVGVCFYQVCDHPDNWRDYNAYYGPAFMAETENGFDTMDTTQATPVVIPTAAGSYRLTRDLTLRSAPGTDQSALMLVPAGTAIVVTKAVVSLANGYGWQEVRVGNAAGFMALHGWASSSTAPVAVTEPAIAALTSVRDLMRVQVADQQSLIDYIDSIIGG